MKKYIPILAVALIGALMTFTCTREEQTGKLRFGPELTENASLKSALADQDVVAALVTIQDANGMVIFDKEYLELIRFGEEWVSRSLELPAGVHYLAEFMLVNAAGEVIWATPKEGSELARLVSQPLPVRFEIAPDQTTSLGVEVVRTDGYQPGDFGYAQFNIIFVDRFCLKVFMDCYGIDDIRNDTTPTWDESGVPIYMPRIVISAGDRQLLSEPIWQGTNQYSLPIVNAIYKVVVYGYYGELVFAQDFGLDELMKFRCDPDRPALYISCQPDPGIIITPEGLHEPTISQGVFGQAVGPEVDTLATTNAAMFPQALYDIWIFRDNIYDSLIHAGPVDCYIPPELIWERPTAIVRTNSEGFFQAPLDAGQYTYMVQTGNGLIAGDPTSSVWPPSSFMVYPMEVTKLYIRVIDCSLWY